MELLIPILLKPTSKLLLFLQISELSTSLPQTVPSRNPPVDPGAFQVDALILHGGLGVTSEALLAAWRSKGWPSLVGQGM